MRGLLFVTVVLCLVCMAAQSYNAKINGAPNQTVSLIGATGTTASIGGSVLTLGACTTPVTITVAGAAVGQNVLMTPSSGALQQSGTTAVASVTSANTVSAEVCAYVASITPAATTYNVQVIF